MYPADDRDEVTQPADEWSGLASFLAALPDEDRARASSYAALDLPKTRSGKIMRRILRNIAEGKEELGDTSILADPSVVDTIQKQASAQT